MTAEEFSAAKYDMSDAGRWSELVAGEVQSFQPPDDAHGNFVLNLSKALAESLRPARGQTVGFACYELGLLVARNPDTVRCPPVSFFLGRDGFSEVEKTVTENRPALVVDVASTSDRRAQMRTRVDELLAWGVALVWVADPQAKRVHVFVRDQPIRRLSAADLLMGSPVIDDFSVRVADLFAVPDWWRR